MARDPDDTQPTRGLKRVLGARPGMGTQALKEEIFALEEFGRIRMERQKADLAMRQEELEIAAAEPEVGQFRISTPTERRQAAKNLMRRMNAAGIETVDEEGEPRPGAVTFDRALFLIHEAEIKNAVRMGLVDEIAMVKPPSRDLITGARKDEERA